MCNHHFNLEVFLYNTASYERSVRKVHLQIYPKRFNTSNIQMNTFLRELSKILRPDTWISRNHGYLIPAPTQSFKFMDPDFTQLSNLLSNHKINYVYPIMRLKEHELI